MKTLRRFVLICALIGLFLSGCFSPEEWKRFASSKKKGRQPEATPTPESSSRALRGTIGQMVSVEGTEPMQVSGFGLVVNLVDTGGRDGPDEIRNYLLKEIRRRATPDDPGVSATEMLEDLDTAMVEVTGFIPAAAQKGDRFDVVVKALGSECKSLVGGRLVLCEMKLFAATPSGVIGGKALANAIGPVFVSPLTPEGMPAEKVDLRMGTVMGGGQVLEDRRLWLVLNHPSYGDARAIVERLNSRYRVDDPMAVAQSGSYVDLKIPDEYRKRKEWFLERVAHTHRFNAPGPLERLAEELKQEFAQADAPYDDIGLAWEAIGEVVLPQVREFYGDKNNKAAYYAGRTGLRLMDREGMEVVAREARDPQGRFRAEAIEELGRAYAALDMYRAGQHLAKLLNDPDDEIRIMAYQARRQGKPDDTIQSTVLDQDNLVLDVVDSTGEFLVYVQQSQVPRVALFGRQMRCRPPAIYPSAAPRGRVILTQLSASAGDDALKLIFTNRRNKRTSPPLTVGLEVAELIRYLGDTPIRDMKLEPTALGVPYSEIVDILQSFCRNGTISATFIAEDITKSDRARFDTERERPESEF